uniref:Clathrin light chain n=1 Tax=Grammatophora oceanica TaxID=210454 RepID=A0A7S1Y572_9STRA|mmetsp:Transcript_22303/g.33209  ORF Transcript_22303/g.33209 Transcript_22303/m.33209 type:complete len:194 (+) Transcript_22303:62-643(+)|eukprot:CAMPEP_0194026048 /NCGR_PEP_ID=MMETSP0009_2-20130614/365_1 /TAXON_ID=210454 /ORGANISM="Grammatophora oceanica, Strain CCMP 410" /LENGTH=193 /DNA_ID=CAMNT_0038664535 /DNA_START=60 /DNA_END=641 /DNA_ORIENTATION=-
MDDALDFAAAPTDDAPILLGAPPEDAGFAAPPMDDAFVGTVDDAGEAPAIILGAPPPVAADDEGVVETVEEVVEEPTGPSPMQLWNEEWQNTLLERKDAENAKKAEFLDASKQAMDEFSAQRETKRESKMSKNRADEQEKLEAIEADLENDNSWQRVCKMVELSHDQASADVKRMRDVMILLKNDTNKAVALA